MRCEEIMSQDVQWIRPDETVARTAKLMAFHNLGLLPVCNADGKAIGVITPIVTSPCGLSERIDQPQRLRWAT